MVFLKLRYWHQYYIYIIQGIPVLRSVQGTVLGPILFLIYINDFLEYLEHSKLRLFADDSIIYREITCQQDCTNLQKDLNAAAKWEADWLMAFHPGKCTILTITQQKQPFKHDYILHNHTLELVTSAKYLGVTLQSNLKWNIHYNNIVSNANKSLGFLRRNLKISNSSIKSRAYQSIVRPKLEYACSLWDPHTADYKNKLEMVQRRAARYVCNNYHNTSSVTSMLNELQWPSLSERRLKTRLIMFYKVIHGLIAIPSLVLTYHQILEQENYILKHFGKYPPLKTATNGHSFRKQSFNGTCCHKLW